MSLPGPRSSANDQAGSICEQALQFRRLAARPLLKPSALGPASSNEFKPSMTPAQERAQHARVVDWQQTAVSRSPFVKFMLQHMDKCGCKVDNEKFFVVRHCDENVGGGFDEQASKHGGVVLCSNHLRDFKHTEQTLTHELIHAYDHCRAYVDWSNCVHHACSEIRAASLSGDCKWWQEVQRGHFKFKGQGSECVRRRATLSVSMNPACQAPGQAAEAVDKAFKRCYADTAPFDRVP